MSGTKNGYPLFFNHHLEKFPWQLLFSQCLGCRRAGLISGSGSGECFELLTWVGNYEAHFVTALSFWIKHLIGLMNECSLTQWHHMSLSRVMRDKPNLPTCYPAQPTSHHRLLLGRNMAPPACHMQDPMRWKMAWDLYLITEVVAIGSDLVPSQR